MKHLVHLGEDLSSERHKLATILEDQVNSTEMRSWRSEMQDIVNMQQLDSSSKRLRIEVDKFDILGSSVENLAIVSVIRSSRVRKTTNTCGNDAEWLLIERSESNDI